MSIQKITIKCPDCEHETWASVVEGIGLYRTWVGECNWGEDNWKTFTEDTYQVGHVDSHGSIARGLTLSQAHELRLEQDGINLPVPCYLIAFYGERLQQ